MKLTKTCAKFLRKHGGTILAVAASIGVVATAIETGRATTKAQHLLEVDEALRKYNEDEQGIVEEPLTKMGIIKTCWKAYVPAVILGGGTIACILGSNALNKKQIASLTAAYMALGKTYQEYRRQVAERIGSEQEKDIWDNTKTAVEGNRDESGDVIRLFYDPISKRYFHATMADVMEMAYNFNRKLACDGHVSVNDYYSYLRSEELPFEPKWDDLGWCLDQLIYDWDMYWMDFEYDKQTTDDGLECYYYAPFLEPIGYYLDYEEYKARLEEGE